MDAVGRPLRHLLTLSDLSAEEARVLLRRATELKRMVRDGERFEPLKNRTLGMIFEKSSTRTRVSFETGMTQLGGHAIFLLLQDIQLGRGESVEDSARALSRMVDAVMIRTFEQRKLERFAEYSWVPVINGLTDRFHPCQLLADVMTYQEHRESICGRTVAWIGDGNNMCNTYVDAARLFDFELRIACPEGFRPDPDILAGAGDRCTLMQDAAAAAANADLVVTDVWASMGQEQGVSGGPRHQRLVDLERGEDLGAPLLLLFMHCLPAHREEEVTAAVIDGPQSVVWNEAENRLHTQKALLEFLLVA